MTFKKMDKVNWDVVMKTNLDSVFNMTKPGNIRRAVLGEPLGTKVVEERAGARSEVTTDESDKSNEETSGNDQ
jgi:hypothetical protein